MLPALMIKILPCGLVIYVDRRKLHEKGLDVDGSREAMLTRLEGSTSN